MDDKVPPLVTGHPDEEEQLVSFSRFVLPFAYKLTSSQLDKDYLHFTSVRTRPFSAYNDDELFSFVKRRKYFTRETACVLYDKAIWASVDKESWGKHEWSQPVTVTLDEQSVAIQMLPPQLVLFEAAQPTPSPQRLNTDNECEILNTGFLLLDVYFPDEEKTPDLDRFLLFNEYFRFFDIPFDFHGEKFQEMFPEIPVSYKTTENQKLETYKEEYQKAYFERWARLLELPVKIGDETWQLFPDSWKENARKWTYNQYDVDLPMPKHWQIYSDNRTFVWTAAILEGGNQALIKQFAESGKKKSHSKKSRAEEFGHWIRLLNVDNPSFQGADATHNSSNFEKEWVSQRTYDRWSEGGSWYGYSYHSGAMLAPAGKFAKTWQLQYFDTCLLLFYMRMTLSRFSQELSELINLKKSGQLDDEAFLKQIKTIRTNFSDFTILYQFPMLSNQQQLLEMYQYNRRFMELDQLFAEVQNEINDTHNFVEQGESFRITEQATSLGRTANLIAVLGIPLAVAGLIASLLGMGIDGSFGLSKCFNDVQHCQLNAEASWMAGLVISGLVISGLAIYLLNKVRSKQK